jgi:NiFe hydrogenase small subunit HydA
MYNLLWIQGSSCGGDTISVLNAEQPEILTALQMLDVRLVWHPFLSPEGGREAAFLLETLAAGREKLDVLVVEGAVPHGPQGSGRYFLLHGRPFKDWALELAHQAVHVIAIGTCACFGGIVTSAPNVTEASGLQFMHDKRGGLLGRDFVSKSGLPVVNIPGCPCHSDWFIETLTMILFGKLDLAELDEFQRPKVFFSKLAHHGCPRNEYYEFKASALEYTQQGCLFEFLGCKGTQCESDCNERLWLGRTGSCTRGGFPCIACTSPRFPDAQRPYFETRKVGDIPTTLPLDVPKAWYVGISGLSKMACPVRLKRNAVSPRRVDVERGNHHPPGGHNDPDYR